MAARTQGHAFTLLGADGRPVRSDSLAASANTSGALPSAPVTGGGPPEVTAATNADHWRRYACS